MTPVPFAWLA